MEMDFAYKLVARQAGLPRQTVSGVTAAVETQGGGYSHGWIGLLRWACHNKKTIEFKDGYLLLPRM